MLHGILSQGINVETKNQLSNEQTKNHVAPSITVEEQLPQSSAPSVALSELPNSTGHWSFWGHFGTLEKSPNLPFDPESLCYLIFESLQTTGTADPLQCHILHLSLKHLTSSGWRSSLNNCLQYTKVVVKYGLNKVKLPESEFHIYHWAVTIYKTHFSNP